MRSGALKKYVVLGSIGLSVVFAILSVYAQKMFSMPRGFGQSYTHHVGYLHKQKSRLLPVLLHLAGP